EGSTASDDSDGAAAQAEKRYQLEVAVVNVRGKPVPKLAFDLILPDGGAISGATGQDGYIRRSELTESGSCTLAFPEGERTAKHRDRSAKRSGAIRYQSGGVKVAIGGSSKVEVPPCVYHARMTGMLFDVGSAFLLPKSIEAMRELLSYCNRHSEAELLVV